jgi:hypothetical protein
MTDYGMQTAMALHLGPGSPVLPSWRPAADTYQGDRYIPPAHSAIWRLRRRFPTPAPSLTIGSDEIPRNRGNRMRAEFSPRDGRGIAVTTVAGASKR